MEIIRQFFQKYILESVIYKLKWHIFSMFSVLMKMFQMAMWDKWLQPTRHLLMKWLYPLVNWRSMGLSMDITWHRISWTKYQIKLSQVSLNVLTRHRLAIWPFPLLVCCLSVYVWCVTVFPKEVRGGSRIRKKGRPRSKRGGRVADITPK